MSRITLYMLTCMAIVGLAVALIDPGPTFAKRGQPRNPVAPEIVGGHDVPNGTYPFIVALLSTDRGETIFEQQFCAGTLVASSAVLTAAHCVVSQPLADFAVIIGRTLLNSDQGERRSIASVAIHPAYDPATFANDVAVLTLASPVESIAPIALATPAMRNLERARSRFLVVGWGDTLRPQPDPMTTFPDRLQELSVTVVGDGKCQQQWKKAGAKKLVAKSLKLCTATQKVGACFGDSGGPLFATVDGIQIQVGIVSAGGRSCAEKLPDVYTQLSSPAIASFVASAIAASGPS
jgi:secreted trypsin-like serine protease